MKSHPLLLAGALALLAATPAAAQSNEEPGDANRPGGASAWRHYDNEQHVLGRVTGGFGFNPSDRYNGDTATLTPGYIMIDGAYTHAIPGTPLQLGPRLGAQFGIDPHAYTQFAGQLGAQLLWRFDPRFAVLGRVDAVLLATRGPNVYSQTGDTASNTPANVLASGDLASAPHFPVQVPNMRPYVPSFGLEIAPSFAWYITGGFAVTGEFTYGMYLGDGGIPANVLGFGLGAVVDLELLP